MAAIHIVTDSGSDLPQDQAKELGVTVVPLSVRFGDDEFSDGINLDSESFFRMMDERPGLPSTAAPSPGAFAQAFTDAADAGATGVVCINLAEKFSATIQSARNAAETVAERIPVRVVDSHTVSGGLNAIIRRAVKAANDGATMDEIAAMVDDRGERTRLVGSFDTLENLKMGGRIGGAQAMLGTLLSIKPIIEILHGQVEEAGKQRTRRKALEWIATHVSTLGEVEDLTICEAMAPDVELFRGMLENGDALPVVRLGPTIGTHGGPRVLGVSFVLPPSGS